jgi:hypothetical protein
MHLLCSEKVLPFLLLHLLIIDLLQVLQIFGLVSQIPSARIVPYVRIVVCMVILWKSATGYMDFFPGFKFTKGQSTAEHHYAHQVSEADSSTDAFPIIQEQIQQLFALIKSNNPDVVSSVN